MIKNVNNDYRNNISFEAQRIFAEQFGGDKQALLELQNSCHKHDKDARPIKSHPPFLYALVLGWPQNLLLYPYLDNQDLQKELPIITALALSSINGNEDLAITCIDNMIQITLENGRGLPDIYSQNLRSWARAPYSETLLRNFLDDKNSSHKMTAISLLGSIGKLTDEDRISFTKYFNEVLSNSKKPCIDGIDLMNGTVTTLPQVIFHFLWRSDQTNSLE